MAIRIVDSPAAIRLVDRVAPAIVMQERERIGITVAESGVHLAREETEAPDVEAGAPALSGRIVTLNRSTASMAVSASASA